MLHNTDNANVSDNTIIIYIGLIPIVLVSVSSLILYLLDLYDRERSANSYQKGVFNKYYTASFKFTNILNKLNNYEGILEAFETISACYKSYDTFSCMHGWFNGWFNSCQKCQEISNNCRFQCVHRDMICIWLRVYNPIEKNKNLVITDRSDKNNGIPFINPAPWTITQRTKNTTIKHHYDIKPIVIKLQQAYNKYYNKLHRDKMFRQFKPHVIRYFKQYQEDEANIIRLNRCAN